MALPGGFLLQEVITTGRGLILTLYNLAKTKRSNSLLAQEVTEFISDLEKHVELLARKFTNNSNNTSIWALESLKNDLDRATKHVQDRLDKGFWKSLLTAHEIQKELNAPRISCITSFQVKLLVTSLDVAMDSNSSQHEFQAQMQQMQQQMFESHFTATNSVLSEVQKMQQMLHRFFEGVELEEERIQRAVSVISNIRSIDSQTSDVEKFFEDVLANLEKAKMDNAEADCSSGLNWYDDPVTYDIMCDPVKCTDGRTYCRWTILDQNLETSPYDRKPFRLLVDDIDVRARLFSEFPDQEAECQARQRSYREKAMHLAGQAEYAEAKDMLEHVLEWAQADTECRIKQEEMTRMLEQARQGQPLIIASSVSSEIVVYQEGPLVNELGEQEHEDHSTELWQQGESHVEVEPQPPLTTFEHHHVEEIECIRGVGESESRDMVASSSDADRKLQRIDVMKTSLLVVRDRFYQNGSKCLARVKTLIRDIRLLRKKQSRA